MTFDPASLLNWLVAITPDKLAIVLPFAIGYAIVRVRAVNTNWLWIICPVVACGLFEVLGPSDATKTVLQNRVNRGSIGLILGFISAVLALGLHSVAFKWLADKYPVLNFLVLQDEPAAANKPPVPPAPENQPKPNQP